MYVEIKPMDIEELNIALEEVLASIENLNTVLIDENIVLNEMAPFITKLPFLKFKQEAIRYYEHRKKRQELKRKNPKTADKILPPLPFENKCFGFLNNGVIITNNCIEHVLKRHVNLTDSLWEEFLQVCSPKTDRRVKAKYNGISGERWIYKCKFEHCFGYVLDIFEKATPQVVTVFCDKESNVDNWIQNSIQVTPDEYDT